MYEFILSISNLLSQQRYLLKTNAFFYLIHFSRLAALCQVCIVDNFFLLIVVYLLLYRLYNDYGKIIDKYYEDIQKMNGNRWDTSSLIKRFRKK